MSTTEIIALALSTGTLTLIWLVQLVIYPSFLLIPGASFAAFHARYTSRVSFVVVPLMLLQAGAVGMLLYGTPTAAVYILAAAVGSAWLSTFLIAVPLHRRLAEGYDEVLIRSLIRTNWLRTVSWSVAFLASVAVPHRF